MNAEDDNVVSLYGECYRQFPLKLNNTETGADIITALPSLRSDVEPQAEILKPVELGRSHGGSRNLRHPVRDGRNISNRLRRKVHPPRFQALGFLRVEFGPGGSKCLARGNGASRQRKATLAICLKVTYKIPMPALREYLTEDGVSPFGFGSTRWPHRRRLS